MPNINAGEDQEQDSGQAPDNAESGTEDAKNDSAEEGTDNPSDDEGEEGDQDDDDEGEGDDSDDDSDEEEDDDEEPKTRRQQQKDNQFFARRRVAEKRANKGKSNDDKPEADDDSDYDDIDPKDLEIIDKKVDERLRPITERIEQEEDDREINNFLKDNPEFKKFEGKVRKYASHESRKNIPIDELFYSVAGKSLLTMGAKRARKSDAEAGQNKTGGTSTRNAPSGKSVQDMSSKEFEEYQNQIRTRRS